MIVSSLELDEGELSIQVDKEMYICMECSYNSSCVSCILLLTKDPCHAQIQYFGNHVMDLQDIIRLPVPLKDLSQKSSYIYRSPLARKYRHFIWSVVLVLNTHFQDTYACVSQPCLLFFFFLLKKQDMMVTLIFYLFLD